MKDQPNAEFNFAPESEKEFITEFEKDCISRISALCAKRKEYIKIRKLLFVISGIFCFLSALFLIVSLATRNRCGKENRIWSILSVISSTLSIISGWHSEKISDDELAVSKGITFFENAINNAENISK